MTASPKTNISQRKDRGVILMSVLFSLILFAGLATIALSKASSQARVLSRVTQEHQGAMAAQSVRASFLPIVAEAILTSMEGGVPRIDLEGEPNAHSWEGHSVSFAVEPLGRRGWWRIALN